MLKDYRMTRITFGVSFASNMSVKQRLCSRLASFYVDDALTGADSIEEAICLQKQLQDLLSCGKFLLRKWNCSDPAVLDTIPFELRDKHEVQSITNSQGKTKTLGFEWNTQSDQFKSLIYLHLRLI